MRLFVMDVDGTMTDGRIALGEDGVERKCFHARDGMGVHLLALAGVVPAIVSGRHSAAVERRAAELGIREVVQGVRDKAGAVRDLRRRLGVDATETAFVGDDLSDIPPMREAGFSAAPADAAPETRRVATHVCRAGGGQGAVRDAVEAMLRRDGRWYEVLARLVAGGGDEP